MVISYYMMSLYNSNVNILNSVFQNISSEYLIYSTASVSSNYSASLENIYFNNLSFAYCMFYFSLMNTQIVNSTLQNILSENLIFSVGNINNNYSVTLENFYCNNLSSLDAMVYLQQINAIIVNSTFENSLFADLIYSVANTNNNNSFTFENIYCYNLSSSNSLLSFQQINAEFVNTTFENISAKNLIYSLGNISSFYSATLENVYCYNSYFGSSVISFAIIDAQIVNSSFETITSGNLIYFIGNINNNYLFTFENIYCNLSTYGAMIYLQQINALVANSTFENSLFDNLIYSVANISNNNSFTFENNYCYNLSSGDAMLFFQQINTEIVNSTFENISSGNLIYSLGNISSNYFSTLGNVYCHNSYFGSSVISFQIINAQIVDLTFETITSGNLFYFIGTLNNSYLVTLENIYCNDFNTYGAMIYLHQINASVMNSTMVNNFCSNLVNSNLSMVFLWDSNIEISNSTFENILGYYLIYSFSDINSNYSVTLENINCNNLSFIYSLLFLNQINAKIVNSTFENISIGNFIYSMGVINTNYSVTLENVYCNNYTSFFAMIYLQQINAKIVNSTFENSLFGELIYSFANINNCYVILENIHFNNLSSLDSIVSSSQMNVIIINSTFNEISCLNLINSLGNTSNNNLVIIENIYCCYSSFGISVVSIFQVNAKVINSPFVNISTGNLIYSSGNINNTYVTLEGIYCNNFSSYGAMIYLQQTNAIILNSTIENNTFYNLVYTFSDTETTNYSVILENFYCNNIISQGSMIYIQYFNVQILSSTIENIFCDYLLYSFSDLQISNYSATLENIYCNNFQSFHTMIYFEQINAQIVNSTFENNVCYNLLYSFSASYSLNPLLLQNITLTRNNCTYQVIYISGGIVNLIFDSLEFNQNQISMDSLFRISDVSGGNILSFNSLVFTNNFVGKNKK